MIYGFDIDGTICSTNCDYKDAEPYKEVIKEINHLYNQGHTIIFFTSRGYKSGKDWYNFTLNQINNWNVNYHKLIMGKPQFDIFVDDKAINNLEWYKINNISINN